MYKVVTKEVMWLAARMSAENVGDRKYTCHYHISTNVSLPQDCNTWTSTSNIQGWAYAYKYPPWITKESWTTCSIHKFINILLCSYYQLRLLLDWICNRVVACLFDQVVRFHRRFCSTTTCNSCWFINKRISWKVLSVQAVPCYCFIAYCSFIALLHD